jgi:hypothetical protein
MWEEILSSYDFVIENLERKKNLADGPSRRADYEIRYEIMDCEASMNHGD